MKKTSRQKYKELNFLVRDLVYDVEEGIRSVKRDDPTTGADFLKSAVAVFKQRRYFRGV
jgi:hypothetical protein